MTAPCGNTQSCTQKAQFRLSLLVVLLSGLALGMGFSFEALGFEPCKLCYMQREGYYAAIPLGLLAALAAMRVLPTIGDRAECLARGLLILAGLMLLSSTVTAVFQAGAEWGFWAGPADCASAVIAAGGNLMQAIQDTRIVACDVAQIRILGLSFAGMNVPYSLAAALLAFLGALWPPFWPTAD